MNEEEMITLIGSLLVHNWTYFLGGLIAFMSGCIFLSWRISSGFHERERKLLRSELDRQKERFSQFEFIVEQRIGLLQEEAELLSKKANLSEDTVFYQKPVSSKEKPNEKSEIIPLFSRTRINENTSIEDVLNKTEAISSILKSLVRIM